MGLRVTGTDVVKLPHTNELYINITAIIDSTQQDCFEIFLTRCDQIIWSSKLWSRNRVRLCEHGGAGHDICKTSTSPMRVSIVTLAYAIAQTLTS